MYNHSSVVNTLGGMNVYTYKEEEDDSETTADKSSTGVGGLIQDK